MPIDQGILEAIEHNSSELTVLHLSDQYPALNANDMRILVDTIKSSNNTYLQSLLLYGNEIGDDGAQILSELTSVKSMALDGNGISDIGVEYLAQMPNLTALSCCDNEISGLGFLKLLENLNLVSLMLLNNNIADADAEAQQVFNNKSLVELGLEGNLVTRNNLAKLAQHIESNKISKAISLKAEQQSFFSSQTKSKGFDIQDIDPSLITEEVVAFIIQKKCNQLTSEADKKSFLNHVFSLAEENIFLTQNQKSFVR